MSFEIKFYVINHWLITLAMVVVFLVASEIGYRVGSRKQGAPDALRGLMSGIGAAMLGLLGLLLGFTLSLSIARWDERRVVIVDEANAIGTLWLRAGFLEEPLRGELRAALREYTDARIALGGTRDGSGNLLAAADKSTTLHATIWSAVERAVQPDMSNATLSSLITAANQMIDLHEVRVASIWNFLPSSLLLLLMFVAALATGFIAWSFGAAAERGRTAMLLLALLIGAVLLLIMDVNRPQRGIIEVGVAPLERLTESIAAPTP